MDEGAVDKVLPLRKKKKEKVFFHSRVFLVYSSPFIEDRENESVNR